MLRPPRSVLAARVWLARVAAFALIVFVQAGARADSTSERADSLFREGRELMAHAQFAEARDKLEQSQRLDRGIGTLFNLADCNEHLGLVATAWNQFSEVAYEARATNQPARASLANVRAAALLPTVPRLVIDGVAPPGADVTKDGVVVSIAEIEKGILLDPGPHTIRVERGSEVMLEKVVTASEGKTARVDITSLEDARDSPPTTTTTTAAVVRPSALTPAMVRVSSTPAAYDGHTSTQKILGATIAGLGLASIGAGTYFGIESMNKRDDSRAHCVGSVCDAVGVDLRNSALSSGNLSTVFFVAGAITAVGGGVLFFTAPRSQEETTSILRRSRVTPITVAPFVGKAGSGLMLSGAFQ